MRIYSAPSYVDITPAQTFYDLNLKQISKDFWQAPTVLEEAAFLPTATANAGFFRQMTKYDASAIKKTFSVILTAAESATMQAMKASAQTEWYVDTGTAIYLCMVLFTFAWQSGQTVATLDISVLEAV